ncbi:transmembrane protein 192 [Salarias fasciatus]|uniref:Transmembrane protein 192 n=1 Tax=Salarias fasciatus TaxID=181472 RepID=A0A672H1E1_SALFA|nr:transmembrane protein 192 [Salarias fasciatus]
MDSKGPPPYAQGGSSADMSRSLEDDSLVDGPLISADALHSAIRREFQTVPTSYHASFLSVLHVIYVVLSVCLGVLCVLKFGQEEVCKKILDSVQGGSVIVYGKVCLWALVLLFTACVRRHHSRAQSRGYLQFYRQMENVKHLPFIVHSTGNVVLLVVLAAEFQPPVHIYLLLTILGLEVLVAVPCLIYYAVKVMQFNRERPAPDVNQEDLSHSYNVTHSPTEIGFRGGSGLEEVVEKQADLIEYLKQHNTSLSKRLLNITAQH